ncbi:hypothetical protein [Candidatus Skiveiella danica]|uniref:hypothetical protein n=1 Tax=Candidatus Skiveiella danica TaxID=3386177 RepID=UPI001D4CE47E|nr:hypothetical protein [Betaproteobacteria bacterium]
MERVGDVFGSKTGPKLITSVLQRLNLARVAESSSVYYPIHYNEFIRLYEPDHYEWCKERADGALAVHLWNEFRARYFIPSTILPPAGSFVYRRLLQACPELASAPTLPLTTFRALVDYVGLSRNYNRLLKLEQDLLNSRLHRIKSGLRRALGRG